MSPFLEIFKYIIIVQIISEILKKCFSSVNDFDMNEVEKDKVTKGSSNKSQEKGSKWGTNKQTQENQVNNSQRDKRNKSNRDSHSETNNKDEYLQRFL